MSQVRSTVHREYARERVDGQSQAFGAWAKRTLAIAATVAPLAANVIDLANWKHCDELFGFYRDKLTPEQAAAKDSFANYDWKGRA